jgi:hypothetical protein
MNSIMKPVSGIVGEVDELERPTHCHRKTMVIAFFNGTGEDFLNILPEAGPWTQAALLERLLVDWKMPATPSGKIHTKRK